MFYIINTMKKHQILLYHVPIYNEKQVLIWTCVLSKWQFSSVPYLNKWH